MDWNEELKTPFPGKKYAALREALIDVHLRKTYGAKGGPSINDCLKLCRTKTDRGNVKVFFHNVDLEIDAIDRALNGEV